MSNIKSSNKVFLTLSDLQLYANLNPDKKGIQKDLYSFKSKIHEDGSYDFSTEDVDSIKNFSKEKSRLQKKIESHLETLEKNIVSKSPYSIFIPDEYFKILKKLDKFTNSKKFYKWIGNESSTGEQVTQYSQIKSDKILALSSQLSNLKNSLNINKVINFYYIDSISLLNFSFQYDVSETEIKIFLPEKLENNLSIDDIYIITLICISKYLLTDLENANLNKLKRKLNEYIENQSNEIKTDLIKFFGSKWESFIYSYYSIEQLNELIRDRLLLFLTGDKKRIIEFYNKIYKIKEESFELDEEIYLIEDIWEEQNLSKEIFNNEPEHKLRVDFLESYKGPYLFGKDFKKVKIWSTKDRKEIKEHYF